MTERQADGRANERAGGGAALKRRGILAAAGAAVAALLAKQAAQPVAAVNYLQLESSTNSEVSGTGLVYTGGSFSTTAALSVVDHASAFSIPQGAMIAGVAARPSTAGGPATNVGVWGTGPAYGVYGASDTIGVYGTGRPDGGIGVQGAAGWGVSGNGVGIGVYGHASDPSGTGVSGRHDGGGNGVFGYSNNGRAVYGSTNGGYGVLGVSGTLNGVVGQSTSGIGVVGSSSSSYGVYGSSSTGIAVYGFSTGSYGVVGGTTASGGYGGYFATSANNSFGLRAEVQGAATGSYGLYATAPAGSTAAYFTGNVYINGSLTVADMTQKHGLLRGPDGAAHLMYTMEAPESWAEDFGEGTLTSGKATVTIDPLFASLIEPGYHVFLTAHDAGNKGLAVTGRRGDGFTVQELHGGTSSGTFSWRLVGKPKGGKVERLGKYAVPVEPPPAPPLPKVPDPPVAPPAPPKKP